MLHDYIQFPRSSFICYSKPTSSLPRSSNFYQFCMTCTRLAFFFSFFFCQIRGLFILLGSSLLTTSYFIFLIASFSPCAWSVADFLFVPTAQIVGSIVRGKHFFVLSSPIHLQGPWLLMQSHMSQSFLAKYWHFERRCGPCHDSYHQVGMEHMSLHQSLRVGQLNQKLSQLVYVIDCHRKKNLFLLSSR